ASGAGHVVVHLEGVGTADAGRRGSVDRGMPGAVAPDELAVVEGGPVGGPVERAPRGSGGIDPDDDGPERDLCGPHASSLLPRHPGGHRQTARPLVTKDPPVT